MKRENNSWLRWNENVVVFVSNIETYFHDIAVWENPGSKEIIARS